MPAALACTLAALLLLAWAHRNIVDDAFIMLRYAENLVHGHGLVWNPGDRVEGYTNFLGTLAFAAGLAAGVEPVALSHAVNLCFLAAALLLFWMLARRVLGSPSQAFIATALLGTNYTFSSSGTQGLGTHMQTTALIACTLMVVGIRDRPTTSAFASLSVVAALAVLVRMDSLLPLSLIVGTALAFTPRGRRATCAAAALLPAAAMLGLWLAWRQHTYGALVPNTFHVKVTSVGATLAGLHYLQLFVVSYLLVPHLLVLLVALPRLRLANDWPIALACAIVLTWCAYVVRIGGDFIEFRFLAPILPFLMLAIVWAVLRIVRPAWMRHALYALLVVGSVHHQFGFRRLASASPIYRPALDIVSIPGDTGGVPVLWSEFETGRFLGDALDHDPDVTVAIGAAGVIPFYAKLRFVDLLGLNDAWVATHGTPLTFGRYVGGLWPAHVRIATLDYLLERHVNLFVGAGALVRADLAAAPTLDDLLLAMFAGESDIARAFAVHPGQLPADTLVVEIPVRSDYRLLALYLRRHPRVDAAIARHGWRTYPVADLPGA